MSNDVQLQPMGPDHAEDISAFAASIPEHDLLFLPRDITRFGVVDAWLDEIVAGAITTKLAFKDDRIDQDMTWLGRRDPSRCAVQPVRSFIC